MRKTPPTPWQSGGLPLLNVAATCALTHTLGPGDRAVVWVQGCPLRCPGCMAPDWIPYRLVRQVSPEELADELMAETKVGGFTFSGGEPMVQAAGLAALIRHARTQRDLSLICFTGMRLEQLRQDPPGPGVEDLLQEIDVLIDGPYVAKHNENRGMRGSANQQIHYLTERLRGAAAQLESGIRHAAIHVREGEALLVGVPPRGLLDGFHLALGGAVQSSTSNDAKGPVCQSEGDVA